MYSNRNGGEPVLHRNESKASFLARSGGFPSDMCPPLYDRAKLPPVPQTPMRDNPKPVDIEVRVVQTARRRQKK